MRLGSVEYSGFKGAIQERTLRNQTLRDINLLLVQNASGKSMILKIIHNTARGVTGRHFLNHFLYLPLNNLHLSITFNIGIGSK
uniref:Uncharacterized protein n=1 Tax=Candidatus Kentrum sp. TC TaxID=2126339 RepID=A0A450ZH27_9GAMM|nr:MAG: hypothetical protein BECKTC1821D_GA0114238_12361 [Candidatus Kentron sp. TC]